MESKSKTKLMGEMKAFFGDDAKRINHALTVLRYAEEICEVENAPERELVVAVALLHDVGIKEGERLHGSSSTRWQEEFGPSLAENILNRLGYEDDFIEYVCEMIAHHHHPARYRATCPHRPPMPFNILVDADLITNVIEGDVKLRGLNKFNTGAAREIASRLGLIRPSD